MLFIRFTKYKQRSIFLYLEQRYINSQLKFTTDFHNFFFKTFFYDYFSQSPQDLLQLRYMSTGSRSHLEAPRGGLANLAQSSLLSTQSLHNPQDLLQLRMITSDPDLCIEKQIKNHTQKRKIGKTNKKQINKQTEGRGPVEWEKIPSVRSSICLSVCSSVCTGAAALLLLK